MRVHRREGRNGEQLRHWYASWTENGRTRTVSTGLTDRKAAFLWAQRKERELADPSYAAANQATLAGAVTRTIQAIRDKGRADDTVEMYQQKLGHWLRILGDECRLGDIDARTVDRFIAQRRSETAASGTIHKELVCMRQLLKFAKRREEYQRDPRDVMPIGFAVDYQPRERYLTRDEFRRLSERLTPSRAAQVGFIIATSARDSEQADQMRRDVDLLTGVVRLRGTKTVRADREVPVLSIFRPLVEAALVHGEGTGGRLFAPWTNILRDLKRGCELAKIAPVTPNDLRRTTTVWLLEAGVPPHFIAGVMGHVDSTMVEKVYGKAVLRGMKLGSQIEALLSVVVPASQTSSKTDEKR